MSPIAHWLVSLAAVLSLAGPSPEPPSYPSPPPPSFSAITALSVGDSLTDGNGGASYRQELSRLMTKAGQPHTWVVAAVPGSKCSHWAAEMGALITQHQPHVIFLNCGTNDVPTDDTEADYRAILAVAASRGVQVVASHIGRPYMGSPENIIRPQLDQQMHDTNAAIKRATDAYPGVLVAEFRRVPANPEWLTSDGIHWTARAEAAVGQIFYQTARVWRGWKTLAQMGVLEMCGLSGAALGAPWPEPDVAYRVCRS